MKIQKSIDYNLLKESVVTIGTFDGVHLGHQKILKRVVKIAKKKNLQAVVLTFFPHPRMVLQKDTDIKLINSIDERYNLLKEKGVDHLVVKEFTQEFSRLTAKEYVRNILVDKLKTKHIIIGYDHHFGRNRTANINDLRAFGKIYDFKVTEISAKEIETVAVSSTKIRAALDNGDVALANSFLGYNFMLTGTVIKGKGLGHTIDFPTANLKIEEGYKLIPKTGSYVIKTTYNKQVLYGMMNIGVNPTVNGKTQSIEMHLFNFSNSIYNEKFTIEFIERLRDEKKFKSLNDLKEQLKKDKKNSLAIIDTIK
ncbi:MAG: bifunctional riboflavin kinase/FAD synthetase [Flavobacteriaceae bacterium]|nr:bifunctional riboflavin kinase/FAD synthetase [Flavobacteriaceae bacterium]